jgi:hypothetical protein
MDELRYDTLHGRTQETQHLIRRLTSLNPGGRSQTLGGFACLGASMIPISYLGHLYASAGEEAWGNAQLIHK